MDISSISATTVALLTPYFLKAAGKAAETIGGKAVDGAAKLYDFIRGRFVGRPAAEGALDDLASKPSDVDRQGALKVQLEKLAENEPEFAQALVKILSEVGANNAVGSQSATLVGDHSSISQVVGNKNSIRK